MNLRNWSRLHTYGLLLGIATTLVFVPILSLLFDAFDNPQYWFLHEAKGKLISLASIANLAWFHWFIKTKKTDLAMGIILATFINFIMIVYLKLIV